MFPIFACLFQITPRHKPSSTVATGLEVPDDRNATPCPTPVAALFNSPDHTPVQTVIKNVKNGNNKRRHSPDNSGSPASVIRRMPSRSCKSLRNTKQSVEASPDVLCLDDDNDVSICIIDTMSPNGTPFATESNGDTVIKRMLRSSKRKTLDDEQVVKNPTDLFSEDCDGHRKSRTRHKSRKSNKEEKHHRSKHEKKHADKKTGESDGRSNCTEREDGKISEMKTQVDDDSRSGNKRRDRSDSKCPEESSLDKSSDANGKRSRWDVDENFEKIQKKSRWDVEEKENVNMKKCTHGQSRVVKINRNFFRTHCDDYLQARQVSAVKPNNILADAVVKQAAVLTSDGSVQSAMVKGGKVGGDDIPKADNQGKRVDSGRVAPVTEVKSVTEIKQAAAAAKKILLEKMTNKSVSQQSRLPVFPKSGQSDWEPRIVSSDDLAKKKMTVAIAANAQQRCQVYKEYATLMTSNTVGQSNQNGSNYASVLSGNTRQGTCGNYQNQSVYQDTVPGGNYQNQSACQGTGPGGNYQNQYQGTSVNPSSTNYPNTDLGNCQQNTRSAPWQAYNATYQNANCNYYQNQNTSVSYPVPSGYYQSTCGDNPNGIYQNQSSSYTSGNHGNHNAVGQWQGNNNNPLQFNSLLQRQLNMQVHQSVGPHRQ